MGILSGEERLSRHITITTIGKIISYSSYKKKQQNWKLENSLEQRINNNLQTLSSNPTEQIEKELNNLKAQLENIIHQKTQFLIQQLKYDNFQYSNKAGKYLANQLQHNEEKSIIPSILTSSGNITQDP